MMRKPVLSMLMIVAPAMSFASPTETYEMKAASCASGELYPKGTLAIGSTFSKTTLLRIQRLENAAFVETENELVLSVVVSGHFGGACGNDNKPTVLTLTFQRGHK